MQIAIVSSFRSFPGGSSLSSLIYVGFHNVILKPFEVFSVSNFEKSITGTLFSVCLHFTSGI